MDSEESDYILREITTRQLQRKQNKQEQEQVQPGPEDNHPIKRQLELQQQQFSNIMQLLKEEAESPESP